MLIGAGAASEIPAQVITTVITFGLVVFVLYKMAWNPILTILDERRNQISSQFDEIDRKIADANSLIKDYEERLRRIDDEARERHNRAVDEGRRIAEQIIAKARTEAEEIAQKTRTAMQVELDQARIELRRDVVELTLAATGKLLAATVDDQQHRQLVGDFIADLEKRRAS